MFSEAEKLKMLELHAINVTNLFLNKEVPAELAATLAVQILVDYGQEEDHSTAHLYIYEIELAEKIVQITIELHIKK